MYSITQFGSQLEWQDSCGAGASLDGFLGRLVDLRVQLVDLVLPRHGVLDE